MKRAKVFKILILILTAFVGIGAYVGGICMEIKPDGSLLHMEAMLPYFKVLPFSDILFQDYIFSGIALIIVNGISRKNCNFFVVNEKKLYICTK